MNVVIPFHPADYDQAIRWLKWVAELGKIPSPHCLWLLPAKGLDASDAIALADIAFELSDRIEDTDGVVSDWNGSAQTRDASGPNSAFRQTAWFFHLQKLGPWLFMEPDCLPTRTGWLDKWQAEYDGCGKPFMGAYVRVPNVMDHLTGISVYPQDTVCLAPGIVSRRHARIENRVVEIAFDVAGATEALPQAHFTNLIQHVPRHPGFKSRAEVNALLDPQAVMFHMNKNGSLIPFLRDILAGKPVAAVLPPVTGSTPVNGKSGSIPAPASNGNGESFTQKIRRHCEALVELTEGKVYKAQMVLGELRKRKLVPQSRRRSK